MGAIQKFPHAFFAPLTVIECQLVDIHADEFVGEDTIQPAPERQRVRHGAAAVGRVGSIMNFSNQLSGIAAPIATGYLVTATHTFAAAFIASAAYLLVGLAGYAFLLGRIEPWQEA